MNRNDIAEQLCKRIGFTRSTSLQVVDNILDILSESFTRGESVFLRGFGTLAVKDMQPRRGRDLNAGKDIVIPSQRTVRFRISPTLKKQLNK